MSHAVGVTVLWLDSVPFGVCTILSHTPLVVDTLTVGNRAERRNGHSISLIEGGLFVVVVLFEEIYIDGPSAVA